MNSILIEQVKNGYIVRENYQTNHHPADVARHDDTKVFETTKALTDYIENQFNVESIPSFTPTEEFPILAEKEMVEIAETVIGERS